MCLNHCNVLERDTALVKESKVVRSCQDFLRISASLVFFYARCHWLFFFTSLAVYSFVFTFFSDSFSAVSAASLKCSPCLHGLKRMSTGWRTFWRVLKLPATAVRASKRGTSNYEERRRLEGKEWRKMFAVAAVRPVNPLCPSRKRKLRVLRPPGVFRAASHSSVLRSS